MKDLNFKHFLAEIQKLLTKKLAFQSRKKGKIFQEKIMDLEFYL